MQDFLELSIDVEQNTSLSACLRGFSSTETLQGANKYACEQCSSQQECQKRCAARHYHPTFSYVVIASPISFHQHISIRIRIGIRKRMRMRMRMDMRTYECTFSWTRANRVHRVRSKSNPILYCTDVYASLLCNVIQYCLICCAVPVYCTVMLNGITRRAACVARERAMDHMH